VGALVPRRFGPRSRRNVIKTHPFIWPLMLGFRMENVSFNKLIGAPTGAVGDLLVPTPVGLERDGEILIRLFCPPYYRDMEEAVLRLC
jgi:hypothetical protein